MLVTPEQLRQQSEPMDDMFAGICTSVKVVQPINALLPMLVTRDGIVTLLKEVQPPNALLPILASRLPK